jgi:hypothetical protein
VQQADGIQSNGNPEKNGAHIGLRRVLVPMEPLTVQDAQLDDYTVAASIKQVNRK